MLIILKELKEIFPFEYTKENKIFNLESNNLNDNDIIVVEQINDLN